MDSVSGQDGDGERPRPASAEEFEPYRATGVIPWIVIAAVSAVGAFVFVVGLAVDDSPPSWGGTESDYLKFVSGFVMSVGLLVTVTALGLGSSVLKNRALMHACVAILVLGVIVIVLQ